MGGVISLLSSTTFCLERVLTWACCAILLIMILTVLCLLMVYGISVGYHYAQKELATFAQWSRTTTLRPGLRSGDEDSPVVRLLAVNRTEVESPEKPIIEYYETKKPDVRIFLETSETPIILLETERVAMEPTLSPNEKQLARKLIGRFRRSRNNTTTVKTILKIFKSTRPVLLSTWL